MAYQLLKPGGKMTYSTCTINPEENEEIISWALNTYPDLILLPQPQDLQFGNYELKTTSLSEENVKLVQRFVPLPPTQSNPFSHSAFFIAYLQKAERN
jgi:methyltransferase NSUN6